MASKKQTLPLTTIEYILVVGAITITMPIIAVIVAAALLLIRLAGKVKAAQKRNGSK